MEEESVTSACCLVTPDGTDTASRVLLCCGGEQPARGEWLAHQIVTVWPHGHGRPIQVAGGPVPSMAGQVKTELVSCWSVPPSPQPSSCAYVGLHGQEGVPW